MLGHPPRPAVPWKRILRFQEVFPCASLKRATRLLLCVAVLGGDRHPDRADEGSENRHLDSEPGQVHVQARSGAEKPDRHDSAVRPGRAREERGAQHERHARRDGVHGCLRRNRLSAKGSPVANTVMLKRIDARTTERFDKKDGQ